MTQKFQFIATPATGASTRERELFESQVRSHASRVGHQRSAVRAKSFSKRHFSGDETVHISHATYTKQLTRFSTSRPIVPASRLCTNSTPCRTGEYVLDSSKLDENAILADDEEEEDSDKTPQTRESKHVATRLTACGVKSPTRSITLEFDRICTMFWQITAPTSGWFSKLWMTSPIYTQDWINLFANEAFAHVGSAFIWYEYNELVSPHSEIPASGLYHKIQALKIIRRRIAESGGALDDVTMLAIMWLPFVDDLVSSNDTAIVHWSSVSQLAARSLKSNQLKVHQRSQHFSRSWREIATYAEGSMGTSFPATEVQEDHQPQKPPRSYQHPKHGSSELESRYPTGIAALLDQKTLGSTTISVLERFLSFTSTDADGHTCLSLPESLYAETGEAVSHVERWNLTNSNISTVPTELSTEYILPATVMLYSGRMMGPLGLAGSHTRASRAHMTTMLPLFQVRRSEAEEHLIFWIFAVVIDCWRTSVGDLRVQGVKLREIMLKRIPWANNKDIGIPILKKFFYDDRLLRSYSRLVKIPV